MFVDEKKLDFEIFGERMNPEKILNAKCVRFPEET